MADTLLGVGRPQHGELQVVDEHQRRLSCEQELRRLKGLRAQTQQTHSR
jgi:hypothetical protein